MIIVIVTIMVLLLLVIIKTGTVKEEIFNRQYCGGMQPASDACAFAKGWRRRIQQEAIVIASIYIDIIIIIVGQVLGELEGTPYDLLAVCCINKL